MKNYFLIGNASDVEMLPPHIPAMMTYRLPPGPVPQPMFQMGPQPRANYYPPDPLQPQPGTPPMPLGPRNVPSPSSGSAEGIRTAWGSGTEGTRKGTWASRRWGERQWWQKELRNVSILV